MPRDDAEMEERRSKSAQPDLLLSRRLTLRSKGVADVQEDLACGPPGPLLRSLGGPQADDKASSPRQEWLGGFKIYTNDDCLRYLWFLD